MGVTASAWPEATGSHPLTPEFGQPHQEVSCSGRAIRLPHSGEAVPSASVSDAPRMSDGRMAPSRHLPSRARDRYNNYDATLPSSERGHSLRTVRHVFWRFGWLWDMGS